MTRKEALTKIRGYLEEYLYNPDEVDELMKAVGENKIDGAGKMTEDTRRALEIIIPIAEVLRIKQVRADDKFLYLDEQIIGISGNSTYATVNEFIGYCIIRYSFYFRNLHLNEHQIELIRKYWFDGFRRGYNEQSCDYSD